VKKQRGIPDALKEHAAMLLAYFYHWQSEEKQLALVGASALRHNTT